MNTPHIGLLLPTPADVERFRAGLARFAMSAGPYEPSVPWAAVVVDGRAPAAHDVLEACRAQGLPTVFSRSEVFDRGLNSPEGKPWRASAYVCGTVRLAEAIVQAVVGAPPLPGPGLWLRYLGQTSPDTVAPPIGQLFRLADAGEGGWLGRSRDTTFTISGAQHLARWQVWLSNKGGEVLAEEDGCVNGSWVLRGEELRALRDRRLGEPLALLPGDELRPSNLYHFRVEGEPRGESAHGG